VASDEGATAVEYALIAVLVAAVIAAIVSTVGQQLLVLFTLASNGFP
jgi:Flp pilus assembly pilin Flp